MTRSACFLAALTLLLALITATPALAATPPSGAVAWYRAENNGNDSIGSNHGTAVGTVSYVTGFDGQAFSMAGSGYINVPDNASLDFSSSLTIEGWIKLSSFSAHYMLVTKQPSIGPSNYPGNYELRTNPSGMLDFGIEHGSTLSFWSSTTTLPLNQWVHVAVVFTSGTSTTFYINGIAAGSTSHTVTTPLVNNNPMRIGARADGYLLNGSIDEVVLYNRALTAGEIATRSGLEPEIDVKGNGVSIASGDVTPSAADHTDFGSAVSGGGMIARTFTITNSGAATLNLTGTRKVQLSGADMAHFRIISQASSVVSGVPVANPGFEIPSTIPGGWKYQGGYDFNNEPGMGWTFGTSAGVAGNGSPWFINATVDGTKAAFIQMNSGQAYFSQAINFPATGVYDISFKIVRRGGGYEGNDIDVRVDGVSVGTVLNTSQTTDTWTEFSFPYTCSAAGNHTLAFVGTRGGGDYDSAIDDVRIDYSTVSIAAGAAATFQVQFVPSSTGTKSATVTITSDDSDEGTYTFAIQGTGTVAGAQEWTADTGNGNGSGNATADNLRIRLNGANIEFSGDGGATWTATVPYGSTTTLTMTGSNADDTFVVDFSGGNPIPSGGVTITGSGQATSGDSILLTGGSHTTVTYGFLNNNDGSIDIDGDVINYTGLEPITDNSDAVNRVFDFNGGAETVTVTSASATQTKVDSTLGESVTFNNPTTTLTINAGTGNDTVLFYRLSTGWGAATVTINGGADDDIIQLNKTVATAAAITVNGDAHTTGDVLNFDREGDATIASSGASPGTLTGGAVAIQTVNYDTVETINNHLYGSIGDVLVADRGPYFSTGSILLHKAASGTQVVVDTTIKDPYEIDVDATGKFVIADYEVNAGTAGIYSIDRFSGTKATVSSAGALEVPFGVKVAKAGPHSGKYIVADLDADNNGAAEWGAIFVVDPGVGSPGNQTLLSSRTTGTGTDFYWLTGLALGSAGDIYVCDQGNQASPGTQPPRIYHVDPATGNRTIMAEGGTMKQPAGLAVISGTGATAELVVVDAGLKKLLRFTGTGAPIAITAGEELGHTGVTFDKPTHVAIDSTGDYVITDAPVGAVAGQRRVHRMNSGTLVTTTITTDGFLEQPRGAVVVP